MSFVTILLFKTYVQEHPQYEEHQLVRNKELEAVLEPKEGEEVVLYEVLDKDIKTSASKQKSQRKDSQTDEPTEVHNARSFWLFICRCIFVQVHCVSNFLSSEY